jgi:hypothetical protein
VAIAASLRSAVSSGSSICIGETALVNAGSFEMSFVFREVAGDAWIPRASWLQQVRCVAG